jgi:hypothetical protein
LENFKKWVPPARSTGGGVGPDTTRPSNGREVPNLFPGPSRGPFSNKQLFLFAKRPLPRRQRHPARPTGGRCLAVRIYVFLMFCLNLCFINYLKFILFQIQDLFAILFCIHIKFQFNFTKKITVSKTRMKMVKP